MVLFTKDELKHFEEENFVLHDFYHYNNDYYSIHFRYIKKNKFADIWFTINFTNSYASNKKKIVFSRKIGTNDEHILKKCENIYSFLNERIKNNKKLRLPILLGEYIIDENYKFYDQIKKERFDKIKFFFTMYISPILIYILLTFSHVYIPRFSSFFVLFLSATTFILLARSMTTYASSCDIHDAVKAKNHMNLGLSYVGSIILSFLTKNIILQSFQIQPLF